MTGRNDFWSGVALYRGRAEARRDWAAACGSDFAAFSRRYLTGTRQPVDNLMCSLRCGCVHRRVRGDKNCVTYACDCDDQGCRSFSVPVKEAEGFEFLAREFFVALAACLGVDRGQVVYGGQVGTIHLGHVNAGGREAWVFLVCVEGTAEQLEAIASLLQKFGHRPIVVLMPDYTAEAGSLVERNDGAIIELRGYVKCGADGRLSAGKKLADRLVGKVAAPSRVDVSDVRHGKYLIVSKGKYVRTGDGMSREFVHWCVIFDGREILLPKTDGSQYIVQLIKHPDISFSPKDLLDLVRGVHPAGRAIELYADWLFGGAGDEQAEILAQVRNRVNARDVVWDARQIMETEIRLRALRKLVDSLGDDEGTDAEDLRNQIANDGALLEANSKQILGGKRVPVDYDVSEFTAMSGVIRKAVSACLRHVDLNLPAFGTHLRDKRVFSFGMENIYRRQENIDWCLMK